MSTERVAPRWRPSDLQRRLVGIAALACLAALVFGRPTLLLLAAPLVGALLAAHLSPPPTQLHIAWECGPIRALEGEEITVRVAVHPAAGRVSGVLPLAGMPHQTHFTPDANGAQWTVWPYRWGRWPIGPLHLRVSTASGLLHADVLLPLPEITVYPATPSLDLVPSAERLARQIGDHVAALTGHGGEFAMARPLQPGDSARHINWALSLRRQELHVNQQWAEHALDAVVAVDTFSDVGPPGRRTLDVAVRGAAATVAGYLRHHDRVGVVVLGGMLRWIGPDSSGRQFYRVVQYILDMPRWESAVDPNIDRLPRQALPPGGLVVVFSPLLDKRALHVVTDLRERGFPVVVVDVLTCEPPVDSDESSRLALRLWRLDRVAVRHGLAELGVPTVRWDGAESLDLALSPLRRRPVVGARR
jgi:uncharacterized protein (DUF58 family)